MGLFSNIKEALEDRREHKQELQKMKIELKNNRIDSRVEKTQIRNDSKMVAYTNGLTPGANFVEALGTGISNISGTITGNQPMTVSGTMSAMDPTVRMGLIAVGIIVLFKFLK